MNCGRPYTGPWLGPMSSRAQRLHLVQVLLEHRAERHHDLGEVALGRRVELVLAADKVARGQVRAEHVAAEEHLVLEDERGHRLGPVGPGRIDEAQGLAAQRQFLARPPPPSTRVAGDVQVRGEQVDRPGAAEHLGLGIPREHRRQRAGVVLLHVLDRPRSRGAPPRSDCRRAPSVMVGSTVSRRTVFSAPRTR